MEQNKTNSNLHSNQNKFTVNLEIVVSGLKRYISFSIDKKYIINKQTLIERILKKIKMKFLHIENEKQYDNLIEKRPELKKKLYFNLVQKNEELIDLDSHFMEYFKINVDEEKKEVVVNLSKLGEKKFEKPPKFPPPKKKDPNYKKYMEYFNYYYAKYYPNVFKTNK